GLSCFILPVMIHKTVKRARLQRGLTQSALCAIADVPRSQLQMLEKGGNVTRETLEKVLRAMGLSLMAVSGEDIGRMRDALRERASVTTGRAAQVTAPSEIDRRRFLEMSRDMVEFVRVTKGDAAAAPLVAMVEAQAAKLDQEVAEAEAAEREARERKRAKR